MRTLSDVKILLAPEPLPLHCRERSMSNSDPLLWRKPPLVWRYGIAVLAVTAALIISRLPSFHLQTAPVSLFLCAVMVSAWLGGFGPGLFATVLSILAFNYYFLEPAYSFAVKPEEIPRAVVFLLSALFVGTLSAAQRSATESLRRARDDLKETVQELEKTNEVLQAESGERKRAEDELQRSQAYLAEAQRLSNTGSFGWKVPTGEILWSDETFRIFQYDRTTTPTVELILLRVHPEDATLVRQTIERASQEGKDFDLEHRLLMPDGSVKHVHVVARISSDESGSIEFLGAVMDVTAAKQVEQTLRDNKAYLAEAQRLTHTGSWAWNVARRENVHWSQEQYRLFGLDPESDSPSFDELIGAYIPRTGLLSIMRSNERFVRDQISRSTSAPYSRTARPNTSARWVIPFSALPANWSNSWVRAWTSPNERRPRKSASDCASAGRSCAHQPGDHHGRADCLPGARSESADCGRRHRRQYLLALADARSTRSGRGARGCLENRERRNPCGGNHQSGPPAL